MQEEPPGWNRREGAPRLHRTQKAAKCLLGRDEEKSAFIFRRAKLPDAPSRRRARVPATQEPASESPLEGHEAKRPTARADGARGREAAASNAEGSFDPPPPDKRRRHTARDLRHERDGGRKRTQWKTALGYRRRHYPERRQAGSRPVLSSVSAVSTTSISVTWGASRDNVGVAGYGVYLNGHSPRDHDRQVVHVLRPDLRHDVQGRSRRVRRGPAIDRVSRPPSPPRRPASTQPRRPRPRTCTSPAGARPDSPSSGSSRSTTWAWRATASTATAS